MVNEPKVSIAVVGAGSIGMQHLEALRQLDGVQPVAVPCRRERFRELEEAGYVTATDVKEAVQKWGAALCIVASDTGRHLEDSLSALHSGLDTLVEKPMGVDAQEARQLCREAERVRRKVFVGCVLRFSESLNMFRVLLDRIGDVHAVRIECQSYLPDWRPAHRYKDAYSARAEEGGVLRDLVHEIDYAGWLFGWPAALQAQVRNLGRLGIAADEAADLIWEAAGGCVVTVRLDYLSRPSRRQMRAYGSSGTLEWDGMTNTVVLALADQQVETMVSRQTRKDMLVAQARGLISAARGSGTGQLATSFDGGRALAICDAARRATESKRTEPVGY
jgi:predicted dehydrogenase